MSVLLQLWHLLDARQKRGFWMAQALALLMAVATLAGIAAVVPFFAVVGDRQLIERNAHLSWLYQHLGFTTQTGFLAALGLGLALTVLLANVINLAGFLLLNRFAHRVGSHFCAALFEEYLHRSHQFHLASNSATLFNNVVWEVSRGTTGMLQSYLLLTTNAAASALIIGSIVFINPVVGLTAVTALCGSYGVVYALSRQRLLRNGLLESQYTEERTKIANEAFGAIREIIVLNGQGFFHRKFAASCSAIGRAALNTHTIAQTPRYILDFMVAVALVCGALLSIRGDVSAGRWLPQLTFLGFAAYRLLPSLQQVFHGVVRIRGDQAAFSRIAADLRAASATQRTPLEPPVQSTLWQARPFREIELQGVSFQYTPDRPPAVRDVDLTIAAGSTVGLVGPSGSGKTTLAELILGLLEPTRGEIRIDGMALSKEHCADWQRTVAYVPQHSFLFDTSLAENIALASERIDPERLREALRLAQLDDFVATLPHGNREIIGEHGVRLSGGQRQRVGIARALYRRASVLVLDEPTSALDGLTEGEVMTTLEALRGQCTIILVAHRPSTVRRCDRIYEMVDGAVVAAGTYDELLGQSQRFGVLLHGGDSAAARLLRDYAAAAAEGASKE
jgi:HlyD family secretion protein